MTHARGSIAAAFFLTVALCFGGQTPQPPQPPQPVTNPTSDDDTFRRLINDMRTKGVVTTKDGVSTVGARAKLCDICLKPLYKHSDNDFDGCYPPDKKVLQVKTARAQCPSCSVQFVGALRCNENDAGGRDRDFCLHSVGKYAVHSSVWLCPDCGYAAQPDAFRAETAKPLDEDLKKFVRETLTPLARQRMLAVTGMAPHKEAPIPEELLKFSKYMQQTEIPDWIKYEFALQVYRKAKAPHTLMATLYLEAAHACRRSVCSELAVTGLHSAMQESLGQAICRANRLIQREALEIRRQRGESVVDLSKIDTDPLVVQQAATRVVRQADDFAAQVREGKVKVGPNDDYSRTGDMYVLYIRYAGALDRVGKSEEAEKALSQALSFVPERTTFDNAKDVTPEVQDYFDKQLKLLRKAVEDRKELLKRERDYLFQAAKSNMAAIKFKEVKFRQSGKADEKGLCDLPVSCYLLGEFLRRAGALPEAAAWFDAALLVVNQNLDALAAAEKTKSLPLPEIDKQNERYNDLRFWITEQRALIAQKGAPDEFVRELSDSLLAEAGIKPGTPARPETPVSPNQPAPPTPGPATEVKPVAPPANSGKIATREQLFKLYYAALIKYRETNKQNPRSLRDVVAAGLVPAEDANLDEKGKMICPETKERLGYSVTWEPGDKLAPMIFPFKAGSKTLFANGEIREGVANR